jgi:hypothetical protein
MRNIMNHAATVSDTDKERKRGKWPQCMPLIDAGGLAGRGVKRFPSRAGLLRNKPGPACRLRQERAAASHRACLTRRDRNRDASVAEHKPAGGPAGAAPAGGPPGPAVT